MITSLQNERVKRIRRLHQRRYRERWGLTFVEGWRALDGLVRSGARLESVWMVPDASPPPGMESLWERLASVPRFTVTPTVFQAMADTATPQGILAVFYIPTTTAAACLEAWQAGGRAPLLVVLDGLQDPGNGGTLVRTAIAAGASAILTGDNTVDLYSPRALRAAAGLTPACPVLPPRESQELARRFQEGGGRFVLLDVDATESLYQVDWRGPVGLIVGSEAQGAGVAWRRQASVRVRIPMEPPVESLNAAVSGAICLYEALRQRTSPGGEACRSLSGCDIM